MPKTPQSGHSSPQNIEKYLDNGLFGLFLRKVNVISGLVDHDVDEIEQAKA